MYGAVVSFEGEEFADIRAEVSRIMVFWNEREIIRYRAALLIAMPLFPFLSFPNSGLGKH